jgi:uncharacterized protein (DUF1697 family)
MTLHIGFLRGVNVGGHGALKMEKLKAWLAGLGLAEVRTLLQSGTFVFRANLTTPSSLEQRLETAAAKDLGLETDFFIRSATEWEEVIRQNPFRAEAKADPSHLVVVVLKNAPNPAHVKSLQAAIKGPEVVRVRSRHAYIYYPDGQGRSKLTLTVIEKHLGTRGTARNWNTVLKLAVLA